MEQYGKDKIDLNSQNELVKRREKTNIVLGKAPFHKQDWPMMETGIRSF